MVAPTTPDLEEIQPFFVHGVGQDSVANVASVEGEPSALDSVLASVTVNICSPRTARGYRLS